MNDKTANDNAGLPEEGKGADDGDEIDSDTQANKDGHVEGETTDSDAGAKGEENDGDGEENAGGDSEAEGEGQPTEVDALKALLQKQEEKLQAILKKTEEAPVAPTAPQMTDEQWAKVSEDWGMDRRSIEKVTAQGVTIYKKVMDQVNKIVAPLMKEAVLSRMEKNPAYKDIRQHMDGVEEFLANFDESGHSDEKLLALGYTYAKGKGSSKAIRQAANSKERNKRIVTAGRPPSPSAGSGGSKAPTRLSEMERQAAKIGGFTDDEYIKARRSGKVAA